MIFFTILGVFVFIMGIAYWFLVGFIYINDKDLLQVSLHGFGVIIARNEKLIKNMNTLRKTKGQTTFITAPKWFNVNVYNIGGIK